MCTENEMLAHHMMDRIYMQGNGYLSKENLSIVAYLSPDENVTIRFRVTNKGILKGLCDSKMTIEASRAKNIIDIMEKDECLYVRDVLFTEY